MDPEDRVGAIEARLRQVFSPSELTIVDDSHKHVGHAGAQGGAGHFTITIASSAFAGQGLVQRHRMVYEALADMMQQDIHALSIKAYGPDESSK